MRLVSFATPGPYENELAQLKASAEKFDLEIRSEIVTGLKDWHAAVSHKPYFIRRHLMQLDEWEQLLWLDADARIVAKPDFSPLASALFAAHHHRWSPHHPWETLTGTLLFRNTPDVRELVLRWELLTPQWAKVDRETPEQHSLAEASANFGERVPRHELGPELCWIDGPEFAGLHPGKSATILQTQASRRYRR